MARHIAYYRVSTARQGQSGLGLEAQRKAVVDFLAGAELMAEFTEVESGRKSDRVELGKALAACRKHKAALIVAKLDRLARDVRLILELVDSGVPVRFVDLPDIPEGAVGRLMLTLMASVAEFEAKRTSERTKAALAAAKARGRKLGWSNPARVQEQAQASATGAAQASAKADQFAANVLPIVRDLQRTGIKSLAGIADALNVRGIRTARPNAKWYPTTVRNLLARAA